MIEVKGLTKRFDNFTALEAASFTAEPGRVCGIVGPNGAGKTTLIKHLVGVYRPDEGSVLLDEPDTIRRVNIIAQLWMAMGAAIFLSVPAMIAADVRKRLKKRKRR